MALKEKDYSGRIRSVCQLLSEIKTNIGPEWIRKYFIKYLPLLLNRLKRNSVQKEARLEIVTAISNIYLVLKKEFFPFLYQTLKGFSSLMDLCFDINFEDEDFVEFFINLERILIDFFHLIHPECLAIGAYKSTIFESFVPRIINFYSK